DRTTAGLLCAVKAAGLLAGAGILAGALKRRAAATRHLVWALGLAGALALLPLVVALPNWALPVLPATARGGSTETQPIPIERVEPGGGPALEPADSTARIEPGPGQGGALAAAEPPARTGPGATASTSRVVRGSWLLAVWIAGTLAVLTWCLA